MKEYQFLFIESYRLNGNSCHFDIDRFNKDIQTIKNDFPNSTILLFDFIDPAPVHYKKLYPYYVEVLADILKTNGLQYYLIFDSFCEHKFIDDDKVCLLNFSFLSTYINIFSNNHPTRNTFNPSASQALLLVGKDRFHRIQLLKRFYESSSLDKLLWSFSISDAAAENIKQNSFSNYTDSEFQNFLNSCIRYLDYSNNCNDTFIHIGYPYDVDLYNNTGFSIIAETEFHAVDYVYFTEKTWRPIVNKHPFVLAAPAKNYHRLKSLGFRTFENYLKIPDYCGITNVDGMLDAIFENSIEFSKLLSQQKFSVKIKEDTEFNYLLFKRLAEDELTKFSETIDGRFNINLLTQIYKSHLMTRRFQKNHNHFIL